MPFPSCSAMLNWRQEGPSWCRPNCSRHVSCTPAAPLCRRDRQHFVRALVRRARGQPAAQNRVPGAGWPKINNKKHKQTCGHGCGWAAGHLMINPQMVSHPPVLSQTLVQRREQRCPSLRSLAGWRATARTAVKFVELGLLPSVLSHVGPFPRSLTGWRAALTGSWCWAPPTGPGT